MRTGSTLASERDLGSRSADKVFERESKQPEAIGESRLGRGVGVVPEATKTDRSGDRGGDRQAHLRPSQAGAGVGRREMKIIIVMFVVVWSTDDQLHLFQSDQSRDDEPKI